MSHVIPHWIDGKEHLGEGSRTADVTDPATGRISAQVRLASAPDVDAAVSAGVGAFAAWRDTSLSRRVKVLFAFRDLLHSRQRELADLISAEHGKVVDDALGEVGRGLEVVEFACGAPQLLHGRASQNVSTGVDVLSIRQPLGTVAVISPFNFPAMVPLWFLPIAIAAGNTVVLKPSEKVPSAALWLAQRFQEAGLPDGVLNVLNGDKECVDRLLAHPDIKAVSFVGSTPVARHVYTTATSYGKRVQALGGAKNHMVVMPDADLDLAADQAVSAAYGSAGERCMAISVVVAVDPVGDELVERIRTRTIGLRVGDGRRNCDMGPLITAQASQRVRSYIDAGKQAGAVLVVDGRSVNADADGTGFFVGPTLFDHVRTDMSIYQDEIFGPVLCVIRAQSFDEAVELINANPYGNGAAIFTEDGRAARRFQYEVEAGMVGVNVPIPVPAAHFSFGGWNSSLFGDTHAYGAEGFHFFTRGKVVTSRWPRPSHTEVRLEFPQN